VRHGGCCILSPSREVPRAICDKAGGVEANDIAGEDFKVVGIQVKHVLRRVREFREGLVAFNKIAVEVVGLAS